MHINIHAFVVTQKLTRETELILTNSIFSKFVAMLTEREEMTHLVEICKFGRALFLLCNNSLFYSMFSTKGRTDGSYLNITDLDVLPFTGLEAATYLEFCQTDFILFSNKLCVY